MRVKLKTGEARCPRCDGDGEVLDGDRCGPSCRALEPPQRACGLCGGSGVVSEDVAEEYGDDGDGSDYEHDYDRDMEATIAEQRWEASQDR